MDADFLRKVGSKGGRTTKTRYGRAHFKRNGDAIVKKYGKEHFRDLALKREATFREARAIVDKSEGI